MDVAEIRRFALFRINALCNCENCPVFGAVLANFLKISDKTSKNGLTKAKKYRIINKLKRAGVA